MESLSLISPEVAWTAAAIVVTLICIAYLLRARVKSSFSNHSSKVFSKLSKTARKNHRRKQKAKAALASPSSIQLLTSSRQDGTSIAPAEIQVSVPANKPKMKKPKKKKPGNNTEKRNFGSNRGPAAKDRGVDMDGEEVGEKGQDDVQEDKDAEDAEPRARPSSTFIAGTRDPEFYAQLLAVLRRDVQQGRSQPTGLSKSFPFSIYPCDNVLATEKLSKFLNTMARIVVSDPGQVAAVTASVSYDDHLETKLYISFNRPVHQTRCEAIKRHIENLLALARQFPIPEGESPPVVIATEISTSIHTFCRQRLSLILNKRQNSLEETIKALQEDTDMVKPTFTAEETSIILDALKVLQKLPLILDKMDEGKCATVIRFYQDVWKEAGYLPPRRDDDEQDEDDEEEDIDEEKVNRVNSPLFIRVQTLMAKRHVHFPMASWILKISSFEFNAMTLINFWRSKRFRPFLQGSVEIVFLSSITAREKSSLQVDLRDDTIMDAISQVVNDYGAEFPVRRALKMVRHRKSITRFADKLGEMLDKCDARDALQQAFHDDPDVHAEITMIQQIRLKRLHVFAYMGVSKLSCALCRIYIQACFDALHQSPMETLGCNGKYDPAWLFLSLENPEEEEVLRHAVISKLQRQLASDVSGFVRNELSDSIVASAVETALLAQDSEAIILHHLRTRRKRKEGDKWL
ncbi:hypothetical protein C8J56DRAFT_1167435 [Mycena floridula]|nr:hypothetical protein C8J56DRAFT_1167435 [Mycena floridula]